MTVRCSCRDPHREHEFTPTDGRWGLCGLCAHTVGAHRTPGQVNADVADRIARMLRVYDIADWSIRIDGDGAVLLDMRLVVPRGHFR